MVGSIHVNSIHTQYANDCQATYANKSSVGTQTSKGHLCGVASLTKNEEKKTIQILYLLFILWYMYFNKSSIDMAIQLKFVINGLIWEKQVLNHLPTDRRRYRYHKVFMLNMLATRKYKFSKMFSFFVCLTTRRAGESGWD